MTIQCVNMIVLADKIDTWLWFVYVCIIAVNLCLAPLLAAAPWQWVRRDLAIFLDTVRPSRC